MLKRFVLIALFLAVSAATTTANAAITIPVTVVTSPTLAYAFNGTGIGQPLSLVKGQTYVFQLSASDAAAHPFHITTTTGVEPPTDFTQGVTGNGTATVTFTVPTAALGFPIFYQCGVHSFMTAQLNLLSTPVPAIGTAATAALVALVLAGGLVALRRRARAST